MNATKAVKCASVLALAFSLPAVAAQRPGTKRRVTHVCGNEATEFTVITKRADATTQKGVLASADGLKVKLDCAVVPPPPADGPFIADGINPILECTEARAGDGRYLVQVWSGGFMGGTWATVSQEQIFPLEPMSIATIPCDRDRGE